MSSIDKKLNRKIFKKKSYRSYLSIGETLEDIADLGKAEQIKTELNLLPKVTTKSTFLKIKRSGPTRPWQETLTPEMKLNADYEIITKDKENLKLQSIIKRYEKFKEYLIQNPEFLKAVEEKLKNFEVDTNLLEIIAFEEFKGIS